MEKISPHEPRAELLSPEDVDKDVASLDEELLGPKELEEDVATLDRLLAEKRKAAILSELDPETWHLLEELVEQGICQDEKEAVTRAVRAFVLAVSPQPYKLVQE